MTSSYLLYMHVSFTVVTKVIFRSLNDFVRRYRLYIHCVRLNFTLLTHHSIVQGVGGNIHITCTDVV